MGRVLKRDVEEVCIGCGLLICTRQSGFRCWKHSYPLIKPGTFFNPDLNATEPETCEDFTPKAVTRFVLRMEKNKSPLKYGRPTPDGYKIDIVGWSHYSGVLTVEPLGYSKWVGGKDGVQLFLETHKHLPIEMEPSVEIEH